jgi:hypothetical protein
MKQLNANDVDLDAMLADMNELTNLLYEICAYYRLSKESGELDYEVFTKWVVVQAGRLYIKLVLQRDAGQA